MTGDSEGKRELLLGVAYGSVTSSPVTSYHVILVSATVLQHKSMTHCKVTEVVSKIPPG